MFKLSCHLTVNYLETEIEAELTDRPITLEELGQALRKLIDEEKDMTSFVLSASILDEPKLKPKQD